MKIRFERVLVGVLFLGVFSCASTDVNKIHVPVKVRESKLLRCETRGVAMCCGYVGETCYIRCMNMTKEGGGKGDDVFQHPIDCFGKHGRKM